MIAALKTFWQGRSVRERLLAGLLGALLSATALLVLVWRPLVAERATLRDGIARHAAATQHLIGGGAAAVAGADPVANDPGTALSVRLVDAATTLGLTVRRLDPVGPSAFEVSLDEAPFDSVAAWLVALERDLGLRLAAMRIERRPPPGVVMATVTIEE